MELKGKKIAFLGDSITEGVGVLCKEHRYENILCKSCELSEIFVDAIAGSRFAYQHKPNEDARRQLFFCGRAFMLPTDADIVVVYGGVNDYLNGDAPFGEEGDKGFMTFCGATRFLMNTLRQRFGDKPIVFMTPAHCYYKGVRDSETKSRYPDLADREKPLIAYIDVIKRTAEEFGIYILDLYEDLGVDPNVPEDKEKYTVEGLHFNDEGHKVIAERLEEFLRSIDA